MKIAFVFVFIFLITEHILADTFERIEIVGANNDGSKVAVIKSHFGPSSYAPFVSLKIYQASSQSPLFEKGLSSLQGDEQLVTEMKNKLLSENSEALKAHGVSRKVKSDSMNIISTDFQNQFLVEGDIFQSGAIARFNFLYTSSQASCSKPESKALTLRMCTLYEGLPSSCTTIDPYLGIDNSLGCFAKKASFSRLLKIGDHLWFHLFFLTEPLEGLHFYSQFLHGEKVP